MSITMLIDQYLLCVGTELGQEEEVCALRKMMCDKKKKRGASMQTRRGEK